MRKRIIAPIALIVALAMPGLAHSNDAAPEPPGEAVAAVFDAGAVVAPADVPAAPAASESVSEEAAPGTPEALPDDEIALLKMAYDAAKGGDYRMLVILVLMLLVAGVRKLGSKWEKLGNMLHSDNDWGGALLVFGMAFVGAFASAWYMDDSLGFNLVRLSFENAVLAFGGYSVLWKKLIKPKLGFIA